MHADALLVANACRLALPTDDWNLVCLRLKVWRHADSAIATIAILATELAVHLLDIFMWTA